MTVRTVTSSAVNDQNHIVKQWQDDILSQISDITSSGSGSGATSQRRASIAAATATVSAAAETVATAAAAAETVVATATAAETVAATATAAAATETIVATAAAAASLNRERTYPHYANATPYSATPTDSRFVPAGTGQRALETGFPEDGQDRDQSSRGLSDAQRAAAGHEVTSSSNANKHAANDRSQSHSPAVRATSLTTSPAWSQQRRSPPVLNNRNPYQPVSIHANSLPPTYNTGMPPPQAWYGQSVPPSHPGDFHNGSTSAEAGGGGVPIPSGLTRSLSHERDSPPDPQSHNVPTATHARFRSDTANGSINGSGSGSGGGSVPGSEAARGSANSTVHGTPVTYKQWDAHSRQSTGQSIGQPTGQIVHWVSKREPGVRYIAELRAVCVAEPRKFSLTRPDHGFVHCLDAWSEDRLLLSWPSPAPSPTGGCPVTASFVRSSDGR